MPLNGIDLGAKPELCQGRGRSDGEKVEVGGQEEVATVIQARDNRDI